MAVYGALLCLSGRPHDRLLSTLIYTWSRHHQINVATLVRGAMDWMIVIGN